MTASFAQLFGVASAVVTVAALAPYYVGILRGRTHPQRAAVLIFAILSTISFIGQYTAGARASLWFAFVLLANSYGLVALSIRHGVGGFDTKDRVGFMLSAMTLIFWQLTSSAALAIVLVVVVNTIAKWLVIAKVHALPYSELLVAWVLSSVGSMLAVLSVGKLDWVLIITPLQNAITTGIIAGVVIDCHVGSFREQEEKHNTLLFRHYVVQCRYGMVKSS